MLHWAAPLALLASYVAAQTSTECNPRNTTCPQDPALGTTFETTFNESMTEFDPKFFNITAGADLITFSEKGAEMTITKQGDSVTVQTAFYIMFGRVEMIFQAASGQGIISTYNLLSDTLDEIDLEIMGGNTSYVSNNFFGWGNTSQFNSEYEPTTGSAWAGGAMGDMHNYTVDWEQEEIRWWMDGDLVRTQTYLPAGRYPQTPSFLKFGIWAGGDPDLPKGTRKWAGGDTDYSKGPFTMTVQSLKIIDSHTNVSYYDYGDKTGSWESIKAIPGQSNAYKLMHLKSFGEKTQEQWDGLSTGAKIGIAAGIGGTFLIAFAAFIFYCLRQRRQGKAEKAMADKEWEAQQAENVELKGQISAYQTQMKNGAFATSYLGHNTNKIRTCCNNRILSAFVLEDHVTGQDGHVTLPNTVLRGHMSQALWIFVVLDDQLVGVPVDVDILAEHHDVVLLAKYLCDFFQRDALGFRKEKEEYNAADQGQADENQVKFPPNAGEGRRRGLEVNQVRQGDGSDG
ncbi:uncharacterized protein LTR77_002808 [Saxophila tyrrhenica]|uniref:chitinase n=1 Tax=Saxophila tyrrhenica TaxID=1690608 RepID=A0AAV9PJY1_9PEZI|nr:hypothetical protein LTR77_002808 [Saxophila tyrrhenica]